MPDRLEKLVYEQYAVTLIEIRDRLFEQSESSEGVNLDDGYEIAMSDLKYRQVLDMMGDRLKRDTFRKDLKRVLQQEEELPNGTRDPHFAYPIPMGGAKFIYKRWNDMTTADYDAWRGMIETRVHRINGIIEVADARYDEVRTILANKPKMTIGQAREALARRRVHAVSA